MSRLRLCATAFTAGAVLVAGPLSAQTRAADALLHPCARVAANATFQLVKNETTFRVPRDVRSSKCGRFVGDVVVSGAALPPIGRVLLVTPSGGFAIDMKKISQAACAGAEVKVLYFRKAAQETTFTKIGGGRLFGVWGPTPLEDSTQLSCQLTRAVGWEELGDYAVKPTAIVYRIAVSASIGGVQKPVRYGVFISDVVW